MEKPAQAGRWPGLSPGPVQVTGGIARTIAPVDGRRDLRDVEIAPASQSVGMADTGISACFANRVESRTGAPTLARGLRQLSVKMAIGH